jgi:hypothetical protein
MKKPCKHLEINFGPKPGVIKCGCGKVFAPEEYKELIKQRMK